MKKTVQEDEGDWFDELSKKLLEFLISATPEEIQEFLAKANCEK